jgi:HEPN domain-containing protein
MPDRYPPEDPREWLNRAHSNLVLAKNEHGNEVYFEDLCFNAQQAAEKAIKAVFVFHQIPYPYIHDLAALVTLLIKNGIIVPDTIKESAKLTRFAIATRYPQIHAPVSDREYQRAMVIAEEVVGWSEREISSMTQE